MSRESQFNVEMEMQLCCWQRFNLNRISILLILFVIALSWENEERNAIDRKKETGLFQTAMNNSETFMKLQHCHSTTTTTTTWITDMDNKHGSFRINCMSELNWEISLNNSRVRAVNHEIDIKCHFDYGITLRLPWFMADQLFRYYAPVLILSKHEDRGVTWEEETPFARKYATSFSFVNQ